MQVPICRVPLEADKQSTQQHINIVQLSSREITCNR